MVCTASEGGPGSRQWVGTAVRGGSLRVAFKGFLSAVHCDALTLRVTGSPEDAGAVRVGTREYSLDGWRCYRDLPRSFLAVADEAICWDHSNVGWPWGFEPVVPTRVDVCVDLDCCPPDHWWLDHIAGVRNGTKSFEVRKGSAILTAGSRESPCYLRVYHKLDGRPWHKSEWGKGTAVRVEFERKNKTFMDRPEVLGWSSVDGLCEKLWCDSLARIRFTEVDTGRYSRASLAPTAGWWQLLGKAGKLERKAGALRQVEHGLSPALVRGVLRAVERGEGRLLAELLDLVLSGGVDFGPEVPCCVETTECKEQSEGGAAAGGERSAS